MTIDCGSMDWSSRVTEGDSVPRSASLLSGRTPVFESGRLLGYVRLSASGCGAEAQLRALWDVGCGNVWLDSATGAGAPRPALDELREVARRGDVLVVFRLECLARTLIDVLHTVRDLSEAGIGLRSVGDGFDTTAGSGVSIAEVFGALSECESALASERARLGAGSARARGTRMGRPVKMSDVDVAVATAMRAQGAPVARIADALGVSRATLYRAFGGQR